MKYLVALEYQLKKSFKVYFNGILDTFKFSGRTSKKDYFASLFVFCGLCTVLFFMELHFGKITMPLTLSFLIFNFISFISLAFRRLQDVGINGLWLIGLILISLIIAYLFYNGIGNTFIYMLFVPFLIAISYKLRMSIFKDGDEDDNDFGPPTFLS